MGEYLSGEMAKAAKVNIETLRYYEKHGLLPAPQRSESGYRLYNEETLQRLLFIRNAKRCGFTLKEIKKALLKSAAGSIGIAEFVAVIELKMIAIDVEIVKREQTKAMLGQLKGELQAKDKHPGVREVLGILQMDS
ncbi:MerR family transcriptional regulator [Paenibacillus ihuae]|uniref:MerR family transcriptional regulator n=1 Tax=Paenibacillus ihuae TaxID=1232431 RepID=UPI0006D5B050|nr:MerR family transcriptional regulator [Paenibacillus ihuae]